MFATISDLRLNIFETKKCIKLKQSNLQKQNILKNRFSEKKRQKNFTLTLHFNIHKVGSCDSKFAFP